LEARSVRRGALQGMATAGVKEEVLIMFSGHATMGMLHRYLQWGAIGGAKKASMAAAARELTQRPLGAPTSRPTTDVPAPTTTQQIDDTKKPIKGGGPPHPSSENRKPRFLQYLGKEMPPAKDLARWLGEYVDSRGWPLHLKPKANGAVKLDQLQDLELTPERRKEMEEAIRWLHATTPYENLLANKQGVTRNLQQTVIRLGKDDMHSCLASGKFDLARPEDCPRAVGARIFARAEHNKTRRRPLNEPYINDAFQERPGVKLPTADDVGVEVRRFKGGAACLLDFASWYDQLPLAESVRQYFGAMYQNMIVVPQTLPMGFRMSCRIAQHITTAIVDKCTEGLDATIMAYIDNILVLGHNAADVAEVEKRIRTRAEWVGAIFNDDVQRTDGKFAFLGIEYDLRRATASITTKSRAQMEKIGKRLEQVVNSSTEWMVDLRAAKRAVAAVYGATMYCSRVVGRRLTRDFWPLRYLREMEGGTHWDEWECKAPRMRRDTATRLLRWVKEVIAAPPRELEIDDLPIDAIVFVDASVDAWGAVCVDAEGKVTSIAWPWEAEQNLWSSVKSEPRAAWAAVRTLMKPDWKRIQLVTDHAPLVWAAKRGHGKAYEYNRTLTQLQATGITVDTVYIPGPSNPADEPSRGRPVIMQKVWAAVEYVTDPTTAIGTPQYRREPTPDTIPYTVTNEQQNENKERWWKEEKGDEGEFNGRSYLLPSRAHPHSIAHED